MDPKPQRAHILTASQDLNKKVPSPTHIVISFI